MSVLDKLTEGIVNRDLQKEGAALLNKWEQTGLLEGLNNENTKSSMARLLENQAKELLREASTMAGGDVEGFASVAFPIVRRVFGSLIANDLVSVQPMSLPSGLIFFLDFTVSDDIGGSTGALPRLGYGHSATDRAGTTEESLYGGGRVGAAITGGVVLTGSHADRGPYGLNSGYSSATGSTDMTMELFCASTYMGTGSNTTPGTVELGSLRQEQFDRILLRHDPDFVSGSTVVAILKGTISDLDGANNNSKLDKDRLQQISLKTAGGATAHNAFDGDSAHADFDEIVQVRRLTMFSGSDINDIPNRSNTEFLMFVADYAGTQTVDDVVKAVCGATDFGSDTYRIAFPITDAMSTGNGDPGSVVGSTEWALENTSSIPEIDIKVDSVAVTANTKKLKAKWTPELGQDLNAYHNLDAEVELTSILSEQIALEIDREILGDLVNGATADTLYWSRRPGNFLDRRSGLPVGDGLANESLLGADFTGTVSEWYETLVETINDVSAQIHRKTLRGGANFVVTSPEVANILEFTAGFRANVTHDSDKGTIGAVNVGSLSKKWDVYVDPYFLRNVVLVGRKGGSFLESGYVYAPYVPLQVTPTIFGVEDFVPRKGVMTRYAKKMVRPDMYGLVVINELNG